MFFILLCSRHRYNNSGWIASSREKCDQNWSRGLDMKTLALLMVTHWLFWAYIVLIMVMRKPIDRLQRDRQASQASICTAEYHLQSTAGIHTIMSRDGFHPWISRYIWTTDESASSDRALHFTRGKTEAEEDPRYPRPCTKEVSGRAQTDLRFSNRFYKLNSDFTTP